MNRGLIIAVYLILITCGMIALSGGASPTLTRQGGWMITLAWSSLCVIAGLTGLIGAWRASRAGEMLGALLGASATLCWSVALILRGVENGTWGTASAACMGAALTVLFIYRARRLGEVDHG